MKGITVNPKSTNLNGGKNNEVIAIIYVSIIELSIFNGCKQRCQEFHIERTLWQRLFFVCDGLYFQTGH